MQEYVTDHKIKGKEEFQFFSYNEMTGREGNVNNMSDFNYPKMDEAQGTAQSLQACHFLNLLQDNFIEQMVKAPM